MMTATKGFIEGPHSLGLREVLTVACMMRQTGAELELRAVMKWDYVGGWPVLNPWYNTAPGI